MASTLESKPCNEMNRARGQGWRPEASSDQLGAAVHAAFRSPT